MRLRLSLGELGDWCREEQDRISMMGIAVFSKERVLPELGGARRDKILK